MLLLVALAVCDAGPYGVARAANAQASNAIAILYADGPFVRSYSASTEMALPRIEKQHSWYAVWLMLVNNGGNPPGFVQGGLIRWSAQKYHLSAFIALARPDHELVFKDLGRVPEGPHHVELSGNAKEVWFLVDGKLRYRFKRSRYLTNELHPYLQIGAEVKYPPDRASGTVWNLQLKKDRDMHAGGFMPHCTYEDRGLSFVRRGAAFVAKGRFKPNMPSNFTNCAGFNQGK